MARIETTLYGMSYIFILLALVGIAMFYLSRGKWSHAFEDVPNRYTRESGLEASYESKLNEEAMKIRNQRIAREFEQLNQTGGNFSAAAQASGEAKATS